MAGEGRGAAFERLVSTPAAEVLLVTDFDGTLAPIVSDPAAAQGLPESLRALARLAGMGVRVVVLSSRPTSFLETHVAIPGIRLLGDNGLDRPTQDELDALHRFNALAGELVEGRRGVRLVPKPGSSTVHFRGAPTAGADLFKEVSAVAASLDLVASLGRMVIEVRPRRGTKARAVDELIRSLGARCVVFAGDDEGDRDVFELLSRLEGTHIAIGIRSDETDPGLFALCDVVFDAPVGLAGYLSDWIDRLGAPA